ncbi:hypothetical protein P20652_3715 [Pseudoalteromonas sp. BSi20652]|uniref:hypothetical protein n=1 Tax=Pseudoalteromonas sp. BSi20652 TaxID=388384 RepID=UPI0002318C28|nr:hypothetical protein [Pseudoalteromonas sp. BSi20652]GAA61826.1 hypothetical protein P20652_3715 [Pseudoalteromonas sp. BSi20652]
MRPALTNALTNAIRSAFSYIPTNLEQWVARLDGFSQHWVLSSPFTVTEGQRIELSIYGVTTENERMTLFGQYGQDGDSLNIHDRGQVHFRTGDGHVSDLSLDGSTPAIIADPFRYDGLSHEITATIKSGFTVSTDKFGAAANGGLFRYYLSGAVHNIKHYDVDGTLLLDLPLTNKSQGATQLATVGNISATMLNYTEDVWEKLPRLTDVYGARTDGIMQYWELSEPIPAPIGTLIELQTYGITSKSYGAVLSASGGGTASFPDTEGGNTLAYRRGGQISAQISVDDGAFEITPAYPFDAVGVHTVKYQITGANMSVHYINADVPNNRWYLSGALLSFKLTTPDGTVYEIPLTNREQGATQLATVGDINATMINFSTDVWEQLYSAS